MTKYQSLIIYGMLLVVNGISLIAFPHKTSSFFQYAVTSFILLSAIFALITAYKSRTMHVRLVYHELHAIAMIVYSIAVLFFTISIAQFLNITSYFLIYYGMAEIIFCFLLFNLETKLNARILVLRLAMGFVVCVGAVVILTLTGSSQVIQLLWYGVLFILIGIHVILYKPVMKGLDVPSVVTV